MRLHLLIIICFLFSFIARPGAASDPNYISINCGGAAAATSLGGRQWLRDAAPKGSSTTSIVKGDMIAAVDPVPYKSARISRSQFSYSFRLTPGQKLIRLHFNPASYHGFESFDDFFTVEAGSYTLLANFSASITARALSLNTLAKEFCIIIQQDQHLHIVFSPETTQSKYNYAFINGIEIISVPSTVSYCHGGDAGIHVLGKNYVVHLDKGTALETVHRQNIKWGSDDGTFGMWASSLEEKAHNRMWRVAVDVGFRYMVRLHLCELGLKMHREFMLAIDESVALISPEMLHQRGKGNHLWYNYMVIVEGQKREGKRNISISLHSQHEFLDKHGPFEGFEVFKLSNHDRSLASPNPPLSSKPSHAVHSRLGLTNLTTTVVITLLCLANIILHLLQKIRGPTNDTVEDDKPSARAKRLCRRFSLAEIQVATEDFHEGFVVGKGGFGKVYKGFIDNGREIVAIKRLKPDSKQGEHEFWTEIETLCELRHVNVVSLIGYCKEQKEMILVYEYISSGTLADHLYKLARRNNYFHPLSWEQRLTICIGAGRAIDYLHTGQRIMHRDVKTSNILLDQRLVAKVSDFGLAKFATISDSQSQESTNLKGTDGYIDPNFFKTHKLTRKSDNYSFGVVLFEVLCERPAVEPWNEEGKRSLTTWAKDSIRNGQVDDIVAPSLRGEISADSLNTFVKVAGRCVLDEPKERPEMTHIIIELERALVQQRKAESLAPKERNYDGNAINVSDDEKKSVGLGLDLLTDNVQIMNSGRKSGRRTVMRRLLPMWKSRKSSYKTDHLLGISVSAPFRSSNIALPAKG